MLLLWPTVWMDARVLNIINSYIRIRMSFLLTGMFTHEEFVFVKEASTEKQNDSDRTKNKGKNKT